MNAFLWDLWTIVQPIVVLLVSTVGPVLAAWLAARLIALLRIEDADARLRVEAQLREALHQAAANGVRVAVARLGLNASPEDLIGEAARYVVGKNPEAIARLGVGGADLADIITSKLPMRT